MFPSLVVPSSLLVLGVVGALLTLTYFLVRGLQTDHATGDYQFTWGVGIVVLFLLGFAPGLVGLGLYLTVEANYPLYWLVLCLLLAVAVLAAASAPAVTQAEAGVLAVDAAALR